MKDFSHFTSTQDFRHGAKKILPKMFYDYVDSGSWSESTYKCNETALQEINLRQRVAIDVSKRDLGCKILGVQRSMPLVLSPVGMGGLFYPDAEIVAAQVAAQENIPYTLSTLSIASIEDVASHSSAPFWFQLYVMKDRGFAESLIERASLAGCSALVLTMDLQVATLRHKDVKNGLQGSFGFSPKQVVDILKHPRWGLRMMRTRRHSFGNIVGHAPGVDSVGGFADWISKQFDDSLTWEALDWIRSRWKGKLVLKGITDSEDAKIAAGLGVDAIVVSNHGGRVLDGAPASIECLAELTQSIGSQVELHLDSGVRSGQDIMRALGTGAQAAHIGRAYIYALAVGGKPALEQLIKNFRNELDVTMALCGEVNSSSINADNLM